MNRNLGWQAKLRSLGLLLLLAGGLAGCGGKKGPADSVPSPAVSVTLTANPTELTLGTATGLTWSSTNATACTASGGWSGGRPISGSETQTPTAAGTVTYTLSCTGAGGTRSASAAVTVTAPALPVPPTVTIAAAPGTVALGAASTLTWSSTDAASCTASGGWSGSRAPFGSEVVTPPIAGTISYNLSCAGAGGSGSATVTITIDAPPSPTPVPTVVISAAPDTLLLGAATTLNWSSANATACTASGGWSGSRPSSGSEALTPTAAGTVSYTLSCTGVGGGGSASTTVTINPSAPAARMLMLTGLVDRLNAAGASVAVQHGATLERGSVDTNNQFMVPISYADNSEFVTVQISGVLNNVKVVFQSNLGTIRALELAAAPTTSLSYTNFGPLHVNSVTTAQTGLIVTGAPPPPATIPGASGDRRPQIFRPQVDNPAAPVQTDEALAAALALLDTVQVLNLAGSIELVALNVIDTPPGSNTTLEAASNPIQQQALVASAQAAPDNALANQVATIQASEQMLMPLTVANVPARAYFVPSTMSDEAALDLTFNQDGTGIGIAPSYFANADEASIETRSRDSFRWVINSANQIVVSFDQGLVFNYAENEGPGQARVETTFSITLTPVVAVDNPARFSAKVTAVATNRFRDDPSWQPMSDDPELGAIFGQLVSVTEAIPFTTAELVGRSRTLTLLFGSTDVDDPFTGRALAMLFGFRADGTGSAFAAADVFAEDDEIGETIPFTWTLRSDGALVVTTGGDEEQTVTFRKVNELDTAGNARVVATYDTSADEGIPNQVFASTLISSPFDPTASLDIATVPGQYNLFGIDPPARLPGSFRRSRFDFYSNNTVFGTASFSCTAADLFDLSSDCTAIGQVVTRTSEPAPAFWNVGLFSAGTDDLAVNLSTLQFSPGVFSDGSSSNVCNPFVEVDCSRSFGDEFRLLNRAGNRIYTLSYIAPDSHPTVTEFFDITPNTGPVPGASTEGGGDPRFPSRLVTDPSGPPASVPMSTAVSARAAAHQGRPRSATHSSRLPAKRASGISR